MLSFCKVKIKYCSFCVVSLGLAYIFFKSTNIQRFIRYSNKLFRKNKTLIASSTNECLHAVGQLRNKLLESEEQVLGLDCEWVTTAKRQPVALLQLATSDGFCSLFRLHALKTVPRELLVLLEDDSVIKVGVAIVDDAKYLLTDYGVHCQGCIDLRHLAAEVEVKARGLGSLAKELLGTELDKDWRIRCSNWEAEELSPTQVQYAAQDACVAVNIFDVLNHKEICRRYSLWKRLTWSKTDYWKNSLALWEKFIGRNFYHCPNADQMIKKTKSEISMSKKNYHTLLHRPHYSNIYLLAPDNQVLCTISDSKAAWYTEKGLVDGICEDPKTLKLRFEPTQRSNEPDGYYTKPKDNKCVVCGSREDLRRKNVVPSEYRRYFEDKFKKHHSHDVLLLCFDCHTQSNVLDQRLRDELAKGCDAPFPDGKNKKYKENVDLKTLRNAARALYYSGEVLPVDRKIHLQAVLCDKLGVSPQLITTEYLENIINIDYLGHGTYVEGDDLKASVAGVVERVNKLILVRPIKTRYNGEVGDVVVGRITELQQKRWKVDTCSRMDSVLLISSVNLPGGELRRRSSEDEQMMRKYLSEGDLISAEVQSIFSDGCLSLHTRSLKYGKLSQGLLVKVFPGLIKRRKTHFHKLPCGASVILGNNGYIWICPTFTEEESSGGFVQNLEQAVSRTDREVIARLRNCILALAASKMLLFDTSIFYAYEESLKYQIPELLVPEAMLDVAVRTQTRLQRQESAL